MRYNVEGSMDLFLNHLEDLDGSPFIVGKDFSASDCQLTSLEGGPEATGGMFDCSYNKLTSLLGAPKMVGGDFFCYGRDPFYITDLEGLPRSAKRYSISKYTDVEIEKFKETRWQERR